MCLEQQTPATPTIQDVQPGKHWADATIETLYAQGLIAGVGGDRFAPDHPITREQLSFLVKKAMPEAYDRAFTKPPRDRRRLHRRELSQVLYEVMKSKLGI